jgi:hypothetical protein
VRGRAYSPRKSLNCKPVRVQSQHRPRIREQAQRNQRARREYTRLLNGMQGQVYWSLTLTRGRCLDLDLRRYAWHTVLTRLRQTWPTMEAWTVYEYSRRRGVHLHAVIKGVPGFLPEWATYIVGLLADGTQIHVEKSRGDAEFHARYLTKQLADPKYVDQWPRHCRVVSVTRGWCPDWHRERPTPR